MNKHLTFKRQEPSHPRVLDTRASVVDAHLLILLVLCVHQVTHNSDMCKHPLGNLLANRKKRTLAFSEFWGGGKISLKLMLNSDLKFGQLTLFVSNHGRVHYSVALPSVQL